MNYAVGLDIGGTNVKAGLILNDKITKMADLPVECHKGEKIIIKNILRAIEEVKGEKSISGIGVGCAGALDYEKGIIICSPNMPLDNFNIVKVIKNKFKVKVKLNNDANCFVLGEAVLGAGKGYYSVVGLTLGTGVGAGIVIDKKLFYGKGHASEFGHVTINFNGPKDNANVPGSVEAYCSAQGVMRLAKQYKLSAKSSKHVFEMALEGNKDAKKVFEQLGFYLGLGIKNLVDTMDPDIIIIGGKVSDAWEFFNKSMNQTVKKYSFIKPPKIVKSKLANAAILGASQLLKQA